MLVHMNGQGTLDFMPTNLVNLSEASRQLGVNKITLWRWIHKGKVVPSRICGLPFLTVDQVESLRKEMAPFRKFAPRNKNKGK